MTISQISSLGGVFAIDAPASASNRTITLPDASVTLAAIQIVYAETKAFSTTTTAIPLDDTIPQNTEGGEFLTATITPKLATSTLIIDVVLQAAHSSAGAIIVGALFQDSGANAIAAGWSTIGAANTPTPITFKYKMTSGTTSATTFRVRAGGSTGATFQLNGASGARYMGGTLVSSITITEVI